MAGSETAATRELRSLDPSLERRFVRLTDRVFVAAGYGGSTFAFVLGDTGIVAVDAGSAPGPAAKAIAELRRYSNLPIVGLVYTHGHIRGGRGARRLQPGTVARVRRHDRGDERGEDAR